MVCGGRADVEMARVSSAVEEPESTTWLYHTAGGRMGQALPESMRLAGTT